MNPYHWSDDIETDPLVSEMVEGEPLSAEEENRISAAEAFRESWVDVKEVAEELRRIDMGEAWSESADLAEAMADRLGAELVG